MEWGLYLIASEHYYPKKGVVGDMYVNIHEEI